MRWPLSWLFRAAAEPSPAEGEAAGSGPPGEGPAGRAAGRSGETVQGEAGAWSGLPPLRPTVARLELTAPTEPFQRDLAVSHEPEPVLGHLGHDIRTDGPAGLVSGLARPIVVAAADTSAAARTGGPALTMRHHVQRHGDAEAMTLQTGVADEAGGSPPGPGDDLVGVGEPRPLPVVGPEAVAPALAATSVAPESAPPIVRGLAPLVGRLVTTAGAAAPSTTGAPPVSAEPVAAIPPGGEVPAPATGSPAAPPAQDRAGPMVQPLRRTLGESRRLGLGAPLPAVPAPGIGAPAAPVADAGTAGSISTPRVEAPVVARAPAPAPARAAAGQLPVLHVARVEAPPAAALSHAQAPAEPVGPEPAPGAGPTPPAIAPQPSTAPLVGTSSLPVTETMTASASTEAGGELDAPASWPAVEGREMSLASREVSPAGTEDLPGGGLRPSGPAPHGPAHAPAPAPGEVESTPARAGQPVPGLAPSPPPGPAAAPPPASAPGRPVVARLLGERPLRPGVEPLVPLAAPEEPEAGQEAETGTVPGLEGLAVSARPGPRPTSVQAMAAPPPAPAGVLPSAWPMPAALPVTARPPAGVPAGLARPQAPLHPAPDLGPRPGPLPVARLAASRPAVIAPDLVASEAPAVQAILAAGSWTAAAGPAAGGPIAAGPAAVDPVSAAMPGSAGVVQRQADTGAVESSAGGGAEPAGGAGATGAAGNRDQDMDELARKLYGRIRDRLSAELLADRERAGLLVDA